MATSFVSATSGGQYTASALTLNGVSIPANSVYWVFPTLTAGTTGTLSFVVKTTNGIQNGVVYETNSNIDSSTAALAQSDANPSQSGNQKRQSTVTCSPSAGITKNSLGTIPISGTYWIYNGGSFTPTVTYSVTARNDYAPTGRETLFTPTITDNIANIADTLIASCGVTTNDINTRFTIANNGTLDIATKTITWTGLSSLQPGASNSVSYAVDYTGCPDGLTFDNTATLSAPNSANKTATAQVKTGFNPLPAASFAKGESSNTNSSVQAGVDDLPNTIQNYGATYSYTLQSSNTGPLALGAVTSIDKIKPELEFVGASIPASLSGTVYYNTSGGSNADTSPPDYDAATGVFGPSWTTSMPSPASDVQWVASVVPCLDSTLFPATGGGCKGKAAGAATTVQVKVKTPADTCSVYDSVNKGLFFAYKAGADVNNISLNTLSTPLTLVGDNEPSHIGPAVGNLSTSIIAGPSNLEVGTNGTYTITLTNSGADALINAVASVQLPTLLVNGTMTPVDYVSATGGTINLSGLPNTVALQVGTIPAGSSKSVTVTIASPRGVPVSSTGTLVATLTAQDNEGCGSISATTSKQTTFTAEPKIATYKSVDESLAGTGEEIHYSINYTNIGESPTSQTYVIDKIPAETVFNKAYTSGTDSNGTTFTCADCRVYFADNTAPLPISITPLDPFTTAKITANFVLGTEVSPGVWSSPFGANTKYVAYKVDNQLPGGGIVPTAYTGKVGLSVINDADGSGPNTNGSAIGTIITNQSAIVSAELPQAIGNQVMTTILSDPGLRMTKSSDKETIYAGEAFNWTIDYHNDSATADTSVVIEDTVPSGFSVDGVYHTWNNRAITNGAGPTGEQNITGNQYTTLTNNPDGTTTVRVTIAQGLRSGNLALLEGGTIRLAISSSATLPSGLNAVNTAEGCFANTLASYCVYASDSITIQNPDLWLRKTVDKSAPVSGDMLTYTLAVSNEGMHDATQVSLEDVLPAGLCYVPSSATVSGPSGWTVGEPTISGTCGSQQTLSWNMTANNTLDGPSTGMGVVPANSPDIFVTYQVQVEHSVASGVTLTNGAHVATNLTEDTIYANGDNRSVTIPYADAYVIKSAPALSLPGTAFNYTLTYGNGTAQSTNGVYIVDTLPDANGDGNSDITITSVTTNHGESVFYHDASSGSSAPTFDPNDPTGGGWSATQAATSSYIAILVNSLSGNSGPYSITLQAEMTDPITLLPTAPGIAMQNTAHIYQAETDNDSTNNVSSATTATPSLDLSVEKTANTEGSYPGTQPGGFIEYTVTYKNSGTVNACDIHLIDTLPTQLDEGAIIHNFANLSGLLDTTGATTMPVDQTNTPITSPVAVSFTQIGRTLRWDLGDENTCLKPGAHGSFSIYAQILNSVADSTEITNTITIGEDSPGVEDITTNNHDSSSVTAYRANITVSKTGVASGLDMTLGTADDSATITNPNETIEYTVAYNNTGNTAANDVILSDKIPAGSCYVLGSLVPPAGSKLELSIDNESSWSYTPTGASGDPDCAVTNFRIVFLSPLPAPASFAAENTSDEFNALNTVKNFNNTAVVSPGSIALSSASGANFGLGNVNNNNQSCINASVDPVPICTPNDLDKIRDNPNLNFIVMNDLDFTAFDQATGSSYASGSGWVPIDGFTGHLNGNHAIISNLFIDRAGAGQNALFAKTDTGATIYDLKISGADIAGSDLSAILIAQAVSTTITNVHVDGHVRQATSGNKLFAGLVAYAQSSTITNSSANTTIELNNADAVGGLVGVVAQSTVASSKAQGIITGSMLNLTGGLIGVAESTSTITDSYSLTDIHATSTTEAGGFIGVAKDATINRSYAYGNKIEGTDRIGGFVGINDGTITDSFAANQVVGTNDMGGFVSQGGGSIANVYYNEDPATPVGVCSFTDPNSAECHTITDNLAYFNNTSNAPLDNWSTAWVENTTAAKPPLLSWEKSSYVTQGQYTTSAVAGPSITAWDKLIYTQELPESTATTGNAIPSDYVPYNFGGAVADAFGTTDASDTYIHTFYGIVNGSDVGSINMDDRTMPFDNSSHGGVPATDTGSVQSALDIITNTMGYPGEAIYSVTTNNQITIWLSPRLAAEVANGTFIHMYAGPGATPSNYTNKVNFTELATLSLQDVLLPQSSGSTAATSITIDVQGLSGGTCDGHSLLSAPVSTTTPTTVIDISSIPASQSELCLVATLHGSTTATPLLTSWMATYKQSESPHFTYRIKVNSSGFTSNTILNTVAASTSTPEISSTDNSKSYSHTLAEQDISITKTVDKASVNLADIAAQVPLTYTIHVENNGPSAAAYSSIMDSLPTLVQAPSQLSTTPTSAGQNLKCDYLPGTHSVYCDDDGLDSTPSQLTLAAGESFTVTVTAPVSPSTTLSDTIVNFVEASSATYDTNPLNNTATATTVVGDFSNLSVIKSGPTYTGINKDVTYQITLTNNGNIAADKVDIVDTLPTEDQNADGILSSAEDINGNNIIDPLVSFVSATQSSGATTVACTHQNDTIFCDDDGLDSTGSGLSLHPGESVIITVVLHVNNDLGLLVHQAKITNQVSASTQSIQTNINDDYAMTTAQIRASDLSSIAGKVWLDNADNGDDTNLDGNDTPLSGVKVLVGGIDIYGTIYGPDKALYPQEYEELMADLVTQCGASAITPACPNTLGSNAPYSATAAYPAGYIVMTEQSTTATGDYSFVGLKPGTYNLLEIQPVQWRSLASDGGFLGYSGTTPNTNPARDGEGSLETGNQSLSNKIGGYGSPKTGIVLYEGDASIQNNFIEAGGTIGNHVFKDNNNNGKFDSGDQPFATVEITLWSDNNQNGIIDSGDTPKAVQMTDANGHYQFGGLETSTTNGSDAHYIVKVSDSSNITNGYASVLGVAGADENGQPPSGTTIVLNSSVSQVSYADFAFAPLSQIGDRIWFDKNKNGLQDAGEVGIAGVTVELRSGANTVSTSVTDGNGNYRFSNVAPGNYTIHVVYPAGLTITTPDTGANDAVDSDVLGTGSSNIFTVAPGEYLQTVDAGFYTTDPAITLGSISGSVWYDLLRNDLQDPSEINLPGINVELLDASGTVISTTSSDGTGSYTFNGLLPASYKVRVIPTGGLLKVLQHVGSNTSVDSDFSPSTATTDTLTISSGQSLTDIDSGLYLPGNVTPGSLSGTVWNDVNTNNLQDTTESGVPGQTIELLQNGSVVQTTVSSASGTYAFTGLLPGSYQVRIIQLPGWNLATANQGNDDTIDSDFNPYTKVTSSYTVISGESFEDIDAGLFATSPTQAGSISGSVWNDVNNNGIFDNEAYRSNVVVALYDQASTLITTTTTDVNGNYSFLNILPGTYSVVFNAPAGTALTLQDRGTDDSLDSDANPSSGATNLFALGSGQALQDIDAGVTTTALIGNQLFYDYNGDGHFDPTTGEHGIAGVQVDIYKDTDSSGSLTAADTIVGTTLTDADGLYVYSGLPADDGTGSARYIIVPNTNYVIPGSYQATSGTVNVDNFAQNVLGYAVQVSPSSLVVLTADFGWQPDANLVDPPSIQKTVTSTGAHALEWKMVWINQSPSGPIAAQLADPLHAGQTYVPNSIQCEARGISTTANCEMDTSGTVPTVRWSGTVGADDGKTTETAANNEIVITFQVTTASSQATFNNQACGNWDQNGDGTIDTFDQNVSTNSPMCSDDPTTSASNDPTSYKTPVQTIESLAETGASILVIIAAGTSLIIFAVIVLKKLRNGEEYDKE